LSYPFLGRMRRPEGLPPSVKRQEKLLLGASRKVVFDVSIILSLVLAISAFQFFPKFDAKRIPVDLKQEFVKFEEIENTRQESRPPPPPRPSIPIEAPGSDEMLQDVDLGSTELDIGAAVAPPVPKPANELDEEEQFFVAVEEMPELIGGMESVMSRLQYPELAQRAGVQGRVFVVAYVNEKGDVVRAEVQKGIGAGCDEAAVQAVLGAKFKPGLQRGKPVKVRVSIPIRFQLLGR